MNDPEIRARLYPLLLGGVYIDELPTMHGYEVKGDGDTLQRVENQLRCYAEVYDFVTFIVTEKHVAKLLPRLPEWVGVLVAEADGPGLREHRPAGYNATVQRAPLAALLWVEEVKQFLLARGLAGASTLRQREIAHYLRTTHTISLSSLAQYVRERLMARLPERMALREERKAERERLASLRQRRAARAKRR
jgi:hypothetical protein